MSVVATHVEHAAAGIKSGPNSFCICLWASPTVAAWRERLSPLRAERTPEEKSAAERRAASVCPIGAPVMGRREAGLHSACQASR